MDNNSKMLKPILSVLMAFLIGAIICVSSYAWYAERNKVENSFGAGGDSDVTLYSACFARDMQNENVNAGSYVWDTGVKMNVNQKFGEQYVAPNFKTHFGTVDNLENIKNENIMWFCFKVKTSLGKNYSGLKVSFENEDKKNPPYVVYNNLDTVPSKVIKKEILDNINLHINELLVMDSLIVSKEAPETFFTNETIPLTNEVQPDNKFVFLSDNASAKVFDGTVPPEKSDAEFYYIYLRVYPKLANYALIIHYEIMPCVIEFNFRLSFSVDGKVTEQPTPPPSPQP